MAIIDIGSNSVRLVVYDEPARTPALLHNEKVICGLGSRLQSTGRLDPEGVDRALDNLERFVGLCRAINSSSLDVIATSAVREATDGDAFAERFRKRCGIEMVVLSGDDEAYLSAMGVLASFPDAMGIVGDLGGGSLEMAALRNNQVHHTETYPLGTLRLLEMGRKSEKKAAKFIQNAFIPEPWMHPFRGGTFFAVGGVWRTMAKMYIWKTGYPLKMVHGFSLGVDEAEGFAKYIAGLSPATLRQFKGVPQRRSRMLPHAATLLSRVIQVLEPKQIVFSTFGLREGRVYSLLTEKEKKLDPLIESCHDLSRHSGGFRISGKSFLAWVKPLFPGWNKEEKRICKAACLLAGLSWWEHPGQKAITAFERVIHMPVTGIDHAARIFLALILYARYRGETGDALIQAHAALLDEEQLHRADVLGRALRLAYHMTAGAPHMLDHMELRQDKDTLVLVLRGGAAVLNGENVHTWLAQLAESFGHEAVIIRE